MWEMDAVVATDSVSANADYDNSGRGFQSHSCACLTEPQGEVLHELR